MTKDIVLKLMGSETEFSLEHRFLNLLALVGLMMSFSSAVGNYILDLGLFTVVFPLIIGILTIFLYYLSMVKKMYYVPVYTSLIAVFFVFYPLIWCLNGGTYGSIPFYVVVSTAIIALLLKGWQRILALTLYITLFSVLIIAEYYYPQLVIPYDNEITRTIDLVIGLVVASIVSPLFFIHILKAYNQEHQRVRELNQELAASYQNELQLKKEKERLYLNISHDLKTPVAVIKGYADILEKGLVDSEEKKKEYLQRIQKSSIFLTDLINDIFLLARLEDNQLRFDKQRVDINQFVERLVKEMEIKAWEHGINLQLALAGNINQKPLIDERRLKEAVFNIINNAIIHMNKQGYIRVGTGIEGDYLFIFIEDNGQGIAEEDLPHIFDRYYSGSHKIQRDSSGLGLSIAREIVEKHSGYIKVESKVGKGTVFYLFLPWRLRE